MGQNKKRKRWQMQNKRLRFNNTYESGKCTFLMLKHVKGKRFIAINLEFDLEVEGKSEAEAQEKILELSKLWLENVKENNLSEELLNKEAPEEYWELYRKLEERRIDSKKAIDYYVDSIKVFPVFSQLRPYPQNNK